MPIANIIGFDDYPDDELREIENVSIVYSTLKIGYVKKINIDGQIFYKRMTIRRMIYIQLFQMTSGEP